MWRYAKFIFTFASNKLVDWNDVRVPARLSACIYLTTGTPYQHDTVQKKVETDTSNIPAHKDF